MSERSEGFHQPKMGPKWRNVRCSSCDMVYPTILICQQESQLCQIVFTDIRHVPSHMNIQIRTHVSKPTKLFWKVMVETELLSGSEATNTQRSMLASWLAGKTACVRASSENNKKADTPTDRETERQADGQTDRQTGRQAGRQTGRQADRQADRQEKQIK